jgi:hypothetical protein
MSNEIILVENIVEYVEITNSNSESIETNISIDEYILAENVGLPGKNGIPLSAAITLISDKALGGNRVITNTLHYADNTNISHLGNILGFSEGAVNIGENLTIKFSGELDGFSSLTLAPIYLSTNGTITQTVPTSGFILQLGTAISSTKILIFPFTPILQV